MQSVKIKRGAEEEKLQSRGERKIRRLKWRREK